MCHGEAANKKPNDSEQGSGLKIRDSGDGMSRSTAARRNALRNLP